jgi:uncharacterized protein YodC (DUF2158 family)
MEQNKQFNVGNVVVLKSGGPDMAIKTVHTRDGEPTGSYTCQWFAGKKLEDGVFPHESLVLKSEL